MAQQRIHDQLDRIEGKQQAAVQRLDDIRQGLETLRENFHGQMAQPMPSVNEAWDASTDPTATRVPEFMYIGIMATAMAVLLVVVIATAARGWR